MILDASPILAVLFEEQARDAILDLLDETEVVAAGAPTLVETSLVAAAWLGVDGRTLVRSFVEDSAIDVIPFGAEHWRAATDAYVRYGKGRHPARLNFGDCLTYATASVAGQPLLALDDDFAQTDLELVSLDLDM
ncbi:MAG TPA: type II toxin-antitoxin system VapC family toxin [Gaiellaceae bacterium]